MLSIAKLAILAPALLATMSDGLSTMVQSSARLHVKLLAAPYILRASALRLCTADEGNSTALDGAGDDAVQSPAKEPDWDTAWRDFNSGEVGPRPPPPPSSSGTFNFAPPPSQQANDDRPGQEALLSVFTSEKGLVAAMAALLVVLAFYIYVFATGGITDGFDRYSPPEEDVRTTLARDPDYRT
uniref:Transmembrane protein n=1 Tax=Chrysotila carterae TaxID=13221 RepID=A0A7S4EVN7_CHRCT|mmetsp:Transcript_59868/g.129780  ORF Transcript_59868/g.129780 Transcript_59868/m.129780 type:complete len:184 (+) Transcript_59868:185-736(+)